MIQYYEFITPYTTLYQPKTHENKDNKDPYQDSTGQSRIL